MKRFFCLLTLLTLLLTAAMADGSFRGYDDKEGYQYVTFGRYEQTAESEVKPILWRVLSVEEDCLYLCSEYVLFAHRVHGSGKEYLTFKGDFTKTELWSLLNGEFAGHAFTPEELAAVKDMGEAGRISLLTGADANNKALGFGKGKKYNQNRKAWGTDYAVKVTGLFVYGVGYGHHSPYWINEPSTAYKYGWRCIKQKGDIGYINVITLNEGVRPVCRVLTEKIAVTGGTGTKDDPFTLSPEAE